MPFLAKNPNRDGYIVTLFNCFAYFFNDDPFFKGVSFVTLIVCLIATEYFRRSSAKIDAQIQYCTYIVEHQEDFEFHSPDVCKGSKCPVCLGTRLVPKQHEETVVSDENRAK